MLGGERERAELAAFDALLSKCIAEALVVPLSGYIRSKTAMSRMTPRIPIRPATTVASE